MAFFSTRVAQECSPSTVPGQARRMEDQRLSAPTQPDDPSRRLHVQLVFADHAHAWLGGEDIAVGVDLAVPHGDSLDRAQARVGKGLGRLDGRVERPLSVRRRGRHLAPCRPMRPDPANHPRATSRTIVLMPSSKR